MKNIRKIYKLVMVIFFFMYAAMAVSSHADVTKGIMIHYLPEKANVKKRILLFDVNKFSDTVKKTGADYVVFTLGQNKGVYLFESAHFKKICPEKIDVGNDFLDSLVNELTSNGIKVLFYIPFRAPKNDKYIFDCLGDRHERLPTTTVFINNWSEIIAEVSERYGDKLSGWWLDGAYNVTEIDDVYWEKLCSALNKKSIDRYVAFNPGEGVGNLYKKISYCQNIMAGEMNSIPSLPPIKDQVDLKLHILTRISDGWGKRESPQFSCNSLKDFTKEIERRGGMLTVDIAFDETKGFVDEQVELLNDAWLNNCQ